MRALRCCVTAVLVLLTGAAATTAAVDAAPPAPCGGNVSFAGGGWTATRVPGLATIGILRSVPYVPDRLYASDGRTQLMRSDDAGCRWKDISPLPPAVGGLGAAAESMTIKAVAAPSNAQQSMYLYVAADVRVSDALPVTLPSQPYIYVDPTGGRPTTVRDSSNGLPRVGSISELAAADGAPRTVYAIVTDAANDSGLWASNDAGETWTGPLSADTSLTHLRVDPNVANNLYALKPDVGLVTSHDGGRTFTAARGTTNDVHDFDAASGSGSLQLVEGRTSSSFADLSTDAGLTWRRVTVKGQTARSVAVSPITPVVAAYDGGHLSLGVATAASPVLPARTPGVGAPLAQSVELSAPTKLGLSVVGVTPDSRQVLRLVYNPNTNTVAPPSLTPIRLLPQAQVHQFPSTLTSPVSQVRLAAGASQDVPYSLLLPRTPSPVDLMFLVDTTDSTQQTIDGVRQGLQTVVNDMQATGLDVRFGVGEFKDYPSWSGGGGDDGDFPYKLRRGIGRADASLRQALARLHASGGGDSAESDLAALYYSTVASGDRFGRRVLVRPGQEAGYRGGSLRLAFLATDETFQGEPGARYPGPSWARTVDALTAQRVHQIGLAVNSLAPSGKPAPGTYNSLRDQRRMATATGAVAPRGGVDCDGNGTTDIGAGEPLVCTIDKPTDSRVAVPAPGDQQVTLGSGPAPLHLAPLVVQLAEGIPDLRGVALQVTGAPHGVARTARPSSAPTVNLRVDNSLGYVVRLTCPRSHVAHTWPLTVTATAGVRPVASARTTLSCAAAPRSPVAAVPPAAAVVLTAGVAPGSPPNPPPNVNANFNPNPAVNPNAGFAQQDEEQPQLALADAEQGPGEETSLAMSRRRPSEADAAWMLAAAGLMTAGAAGYATRTRRRTAHVRSRV